MCIVNFPWTPSGVRRPGDVTVEETSPGDWFPFMPDDDPFLPDSITDMSRLLHKPAGKLGFAERQGKDIVFEKTGKPVKFWGIGADMAQTPELQDMQARFYAKHGINMVRQHPLQSMLGLLQTDPDTGKRGFDKKKLDRWDRWFWTLKSRGIYMAWSCFYPHVITREDGYPPELFRELPDRNEGRSTSGFVNFMLPLQDAEWEWLKTILLHRNPYTGLRYLDDPALAVVEVHNEDCIFWHWPLNILAAGDHFPAHTAVLKRRWMEWLKTRYETDETLRAAWGAGARKDDSVDNPAMGIYGSWEMTADGPRRASEKARMGDFIRFLAQTQRQYYSRREIRLRTLGYKGLTVTTAWRAGGPAADAANTWCDDTMDVISRHAYFGGGEGKHRIAAGKVLNGTHLAEPGSGILSAGFHQVEDKPFFISEWTQKPPNQWKAEITPLVAFYGLGLQGWDASCHFAGNKPRMGSGWPDMRSYVTETPHYLGQFPAVAFAVHNNHFKEAPVISARRVKVDDIFRGIDALRRDSPKSGPGVSAEALAAGRVTVKIGDSTPPSSITDWSQCRDAVNNTIKSATGELSWDYGRRVVQLHSRKTQGVIGFCGGQGHDLPAVHLTVKTPFAVILFTPLDDLDLADSRHILVTALARDRQTGAEYNDDGSKLIKTGMPPLLLEPVQARIRFKGSRTITVKAVDIYGRPTESISTRKDGTFTIDGRYKTYYYEVKR